AAAACTPVAPRWHSASGRLSTEGIRHPPAPLPRAPRGSVSTSACNATASASHIGFARLDGLALAGGTSLPPVPQSEPAARNSPRRPPRSPLQPVPLWPARGTGCGGLAGVPGGRKASPWRAGSTEHVRLGLARLSVCCDTKANDSLRNESGRP